MPLLQQVVELLSQAPGNVVYHLVTLLTLQVVFAISYSQLQREPGDPVARRMTWASGVIFLTRLSLLLVGILLSDDSAGAAALLPPLQHAADTFTAALVVWGLAPQSKRFPRLADTLLLVILIGITVAAAIFVNNWQDSATAGISYLGSRQATTWNLTQVVLLGVGFALTLSARHLRSSLNPVVIGLLLVTQILNLANASRPVVSESDIAYWVRLGHLMAFPLWAALVYRHSFGSLLNAQRGRQPSVEQIRQFLQHSSQVVTSLDPEEVLNGAIDMVSNTLDAVFVGIALSEGENRKHVRIVSNQPQIDRDQPRQWTVDLNEWPPFRLAIEQRQSVHLVPDGLGARQLFDWYEAMGIVPLGALLIQPPDEESVMALLILAGPEGQKRWSEHDKSLAAALANYASQVIDATYSSAQARSLAPPATSKETDSAVSGRIVALEGERKRLTSELETTKSRLIRAEEQAGVSSKRARDLAATLQEMEGLQRGQRIEELEKEIESLRESLIEAEEAMALAAAGEGGLSTEWVMLTITRYSGQLEEAQARIQSLEAELGHWERGPTNQVVASLVQELRTPMTSIGGYTDLLLSKQAGTLGSRQSDFVQRIKANVERMGSLLEQIVQMTKTAEQPEESATADELVNVQDVIEAAISAVITQIREKKLHLDLDIATDLPELDVDASALSHIMTSLLGNACQSTQNNGRVAVAARAYSLPEAEKNGQHGAIDYVKLSVVDSGGGISPDDWSRVFDPQHRAENPLIAGLGDTGAALAVARTLTEENGGRIWLDSEPGIGSTFSTMFPIATRMTESTIVESVAPASEMSARTNGE